MSSNIQFSADRKKAKEGEYIIVTWSCDTPDAVSLTVDNGYTTTRTQLPDSGSRSVTIEKSKGKTVLTLTAVLGGKAQRESIEIKVENIKAIRGEKANQVPLMDRVKDLFSKWFAPVKNAFGGGRKGSLKSRFLSFMQRLAYGWSVMPERRKRIWKYTIIALLCLWMVGMCTPRRSRYYYQQPQVEQQQSQSADDGMTSV